MNTTNDKSLQLTIAKEEKRKMISGWIKMIGIFLVMQGATIIVLSSFK